MTFGPFRFHPLACLALVLGAAAVIFCLIAFH